MDPTNEVERERLFRAVRSSFRGLEPFRRLNKGLIEEYAGAQYGAESAKYDIALNLMNQAVDAYTMALVANRPRVLATSKHDDLVGFSQIFQVALNNLIEEIGLEFTLRRWVLDAFFCVGIVKTHFADSGLVQLEDSRWADPGKPFASNVGLSNWVHDMSVSRWDQVRFAGDMYRIPFADLETDIYDQKVVDKLQPTTKGAGDADDRTDQISRGSEVDSDEIEPMIDLADIWVPRDGVIYTFPVENRTTMCMKGDPVAVMPWDGSDLGPYHLLGFNDVPDNIMPTSPASHLAYLSRLANNIFRKQARGAKRQKDFTVYTPTGADSAKKMQRVSDGGMVEVTDPNEVIPMKMGGIDANNQAFMLSTVDLFDRMAGNLTAIMGLGAQADTASQESMIHQAASQKLTSMRYRVMDATTRLIRELGWMLWNDQAKVIPGKIPIEGAKGYELDATWRPHYRRGSYEHFKIDIDVYSMAYQSPAQKVQAVTQYIAQVVLPLLQAGPAIDLPNLNRVFAEWMNIPELKQLVLPGSTPPGLATGDVGKPSSTTRNYVRRNVPTGGTAQSRSQVQQQSWLNSSQNSQQASSMGRPPA